MEAPYTTACSVDDLLDFASDIGEEDDEEEKPRRPLGSLEPNGPEPASFDVLCPDDPSLSFPVSCFIGHFLGVCLRGCYGRKVTSWW